MQSLVDCGSATQTAQADLVASRKTRITLEQYQPMRRRSPRVLSGVLSACYSCGSLLPPSDPQRCPCGGAASPRTRGRLTRGRQQGAPPPPPPGVALSPDARLSSSSDCSSSRSHTPSNSPTASNSSTPSNSPTRSHSPTSSHSPTASNSPTPSNSPTRSHSHTSSNSSTRSNSPTPSNSPTRAHSHTPSNSHTRSPSPSNSSTASHSPTRSHSPTPSNSPTSSHSPSPSLSLSLSHCSTHSLSPVPALSPTSSLSIAPPYCPSPAYSLIPPLSSTPSYCPSPAYSLIAPLSPASVSSGNSSDCRSCSPTPARLPTSAPRSRARTTGPPSSPPRAASPHYSPPRLASPHFSPLRTVTPLSNLSWALRPSSSPPRTTCRPSSPPRTTSPLSSLNWALGPPSSPPRTTSPLSSLSWALGPPSSPPRTTGRPSSPHLPANPASSLSWAPGLPSISPWGPQSIPEPGPAGHPPGPAGYACGPALAWSPGPPNPPPVPTRNSAMPISVASIFAPLPFLEIVEELIPPTVRSQHSSLNFFWDPTRSGANGRPCSTQVLLRLVGYTASHAPISPGTSASVNGEWLYVEWSSAGGRGPPPPLDITPLCCGGRRGSCTVDLFNPSPCWVAVLGVRRRPAAHLLAELRRRPPRPAQLTRALVRQRLAGDGDIETTSLKVSLLCPLGQGRMQLPCRGEACQHVQCFDAKVYLDANERRSRWRCPVCDGPAGFEGLAVDAFFSEVLQQTAGGCAEVELQPDGGWQDAAGPQSRSQQQPACVLLDSESDDPDEDLKLPEPKRACRVEAAERAGAASQATPAARPLQPEPPPGAADSAARHCTGTASAAAAAAAAATAAAAADSKAAVARIEGSQAAGSTAFGSTTFGPLVPGSTALGFTAVGPTAGRFPTPGYMVPVPQAPVPQTPVLQAPVPQTCGPRFTQPTLPSLVAGLTGKRAERRAAHRARHRPPPASADGGPAVTVITLD